MLASEERRRLAATIATTARWHPDDPRLGEMRRRLDQLRVRDVAAWAAAAADDLPDTGEVENVLVRLVQTGHSMDEAGGDTDAA